MTRLTATIIQNDPNVSASSFGPIDGKFGIYIWTPDFSPSGCERPRTLLTSEPVYETPEEAKAEADRILGKAKASGTPEPTEER